MTVEEIKSENPLYAFLMGKGVPMIGSGSKKTSNRCPMQEHRKDHLCVTIDTDKELWNCNDCKRGGDIITWISLEEAKTAGQVLKELGGEPEKSKPSNNGNGKPQPEIECSYVYRNSLDEIVYEVVRMKPKTFRQRHMIDGSWVWNMDGVTRVLYRLPEVMKSESVWIVEGEKDADTLVRLGYTATTNVGGAGKWLDPYTESLSGKNVILCGDSDTPGKEHVGIVFESIAGKVKSSRVFVVPPPSKDISDYIKTFPSDAEAKVEIDRRLAECQMFFKGIKVPVYSMSELEIRYRKHVSNLSKGSLSLGKWLPTLGRRVRSLVPGDMVLVLGDTGVGKTALLMNIALCAAPMPTVMFELELPAETMFERMVSLRRKMPSNEVEGAYSAGQDIGEELLDSDFPGFFVCDESGLSVERVEEYITKSQLKIGERPRLVLLDYVQLLSGFGKRYEKASDNAEALKVVAKRAGVILIVASQVHRPDSREDDAEIHIHSGKDSGSLENSSGLVIGAWRDYTDRELMYLKVLKNTKGVAWSEAIKCNYKGEMSLITERSKISDDDVRSVRTQQSYMPDP